MSDIGPKENYVATDMDNNEFVAHCYWQERIEFQELTIAFGNGTKPVHANGAEMLCYLAGEVLRLALLDLSGHPEIAQRRVMEEIGEILTATNNIREVVGIQKLQSELGRAPSPHEVSSRPGLGN